MKIPLASSEGFADCSDGKHSRAEQRQTISLAYLCERSHSQVAGMLCMPLGTVKAPIRLGLVNLKRLIEAPVA
ncbi:hypothetical protein C0Z18_31500 [Trinickia dabaoshanensis]|uniref:RNA polymerase sigma-70 region 4 domain-containing protein n=1 Tax=Trinickia dabaoshanensis TaxID=564714 RepID=A0A2N7VBH7_9BURK|nr:hypothetical protein [Trinickia dabaoshanensis]PMS14477.1 hypothetical protein C0Z18_31500 [Trinickia dabaoshanensis]